MKALITGGNGFIGSHLADRLVSEHWDVTVIDREERLDSSASEGIRFQESDLRRELMLRQELSGVNVVFHLAWSMIHEDSMRDPTVDVNANVIPSIRLIKAAVEVGVDRIVFLSSGGTVYGPATTIPISENHPTDPICSYGITKLTVEKYLKMFCHLHSQEYVILRPSVPYGPRQNPFGRQGAVSVFLYRVGNGLPLSIWGKLEGIRRDFFYIDDLTDAIVIAAQRPSAANQVFNIGGGQDISLAKLIAHVEQTVGRKADVDQLPARPFDAPSVVLDTKLARSRLGWNPQVQLEEGLLRTWRWLRTIPEQASASSQRTYTAR